MWDANRRERDNDAPSVQGIQKNFSYMLIQTLTTLGRASSRKRIAAFFDMVVAVQLSGRFDSHVVVKEQQLRFDSQVGQTMDCPRYEPHQK